MSDLTKQISGLSEEKRRLLELLMKEEAGETAGDDGAVGGESRRDSSHRDLVRRDWQGDAPAPLSHAQRRLWLIDRIEPGGAAYNMPAAFRLRGRLDADALERALAGVVRRHEVLRTTFHEAASPGTGGGNGAAGEPVQRVAPDAAVRLRRVDLSATAGGEVGGDDAGERFRRAARLARREARRGFDLESGPLLRALLIRLAEDDHLAVLTLHHIVSDGWSTGLLMRELGQLYAAHRRGAGPEAAGLPELPLQYRDFAAWQTERAAAGEGLEEQTAWWREELAGAPPLLELPTDRPRVPADGSPRPRPAGHLRFAIPRATAAGLGRLAEAEGSTLYAALLAGFATLMARQAGQDDLVLGTPVAGRRRVELEPLIGFFVNTLALRFRLGDRPDFRTLVRRTGAATVAAQDRQDVPFEALVEELAPNRTLSHAPLFQVMFQLDETAAGPAAELPGLELEPLPADGGEAKFDLTLSVTRRADGTCAAALVYDAGLFDRERMERLGDQYRRLLTAAVEAPETAVDRLPLLTDSERRAVVDLPNRTTSDFPDGPSLAELFRRRAAADPAAEALVFPEARLTYGELDALSDALAAELRDAGVRRGRRVGLVAGRSAASVVAVLAVAKAGGAYVPLGTAYPPERMALILADTGAPVVLMDEAVMDGAVGEGVSAAALAAALAETCGNTAPRLVPLSLEALEAGRRPGPTTAGGGDLAYVIYTSGSTGTPKGVAVPQRAVARLVLGTDYLQLGPGDRVAFASNPAFDAATFEIWGALATGATLVAVPAEVALEPAALVAHLEAEGVDAFFLTTALFNAVAREMPGGFAALGTVLFGGEACDPAAVRRVLDAGGPGRLLHVYGPTEVTTYSTWHLVEEVPEGATTVPIGGPLANTRAYVVDRHLAPQPLGVPGELVLAGPGLAHGYLARPAATADRFVPDPFTPADEPGGRLYRTGDLVNRLPGGALEFIGRADDQVKIRGFRIEPGEIQAALLEQPEVGDAVVVVRETPETGRLLAAYVVPAEAVDGESRGGGGLPALLTARLAERLPAYMVPAAVVEMDELPLNANGKVDRRALPAPVLAAAAGRVAPRNDLEERLAALWRELLGVDELGVHDDFFALGGHSLLATRVASGVRAALGVELPVRRVFERPTVAGLATAVEELRREHGGGEGEAVPLRPVDRSGDMPLSFPQERLWFIDRLQPGGSAYNVPLALRLAGAVDAGSLAGALAAVTARHEVLRTVYDGEEPVQRVRPAGPFHLPRVDLAALAAGTARAEARRLAAVEAARPFDLTADPMLRAWLVDLGAAADGEPRSLLLVDMHHIASDGWSVGILVREAGELYAAARDGRAPRLPALPVQYGDFAIWQRRRLSDEALGVELAWWKERLAGLPPLLELPTDRPRPASPSHRGGIRARRLEPGLGAALGELAQRRGVTLHMVLLAGFQLLLSRLSGHRELAVGTPTAGRGRAEVEGLVGCFVNTLVHRADLAPGEAGAPSFAELLERVRRERLAAEEHGEMPFEKLVEELAPRRSLDHAPLVQVLFVLQNAPGPASPAGTPFGGGLRTLPAAGEGAGEGVGEGVGAAAGDAGRQAKMDLTLSAVERPDGGIGLSLEYARDLFDGTTVDSLLERLERLLAAAAAAPERPAADLPWLAPEERHHLLHELAAGGEAEAAETSIPALFHRVAGGCPEAVALSTARGDVTYGELAGRARTLGRRLAAAGVAPGDPVAVALDRGAELVASLLGILEAGGAYVPLDDAYPAERLAAMVEDAGARVLITRGGRLEELARSAGMEVVDLGTAAAETGSGDSPLPGVALPPRALAYVLFTSGSTGRPKAVAVPHGAVARLVRGNHFAPLGPETTYLQLAPVAFDASTLELWGPLLNGGRLAIPPAGDFSVDDLGRWIRDFRVTDIWLTAGLFHLVVDEDVQALAPLTRVLSGGDVLSPAHVGRVARELPGVELVNGYGPTENTTFTTTHPVDAAALPPGGTVPIGRPIAGGRAYVLDPRLAPVPAGVFGELWAAGRGLAWGYLGRPGLTAQRFVPNPFAGEEGDAGGRLYRTGDLVRWLPSGDLEFQGRRDGQVKLRGFRIELGEIESHLSAHPAVREVTVVAVEGGGESATGAGDRLLAAYVVPADGGDGGDLAATLGPWLGERLPPYMVPSAFVPLDELPLTANGKVDRRALPAPRPVGPRSAGVPGAPTALAGGGAVLERLAAIWRDLFGLARVEPEDDFFSLGGHSLLATRLVSRVRRELDVELPVRQVFETPDLAGLARSIEAAAGLGAAAPPLVPVAGRREGALRLSFAQERLWFIDRLEPGRATYNVPQALRLRGALSLSALERALGDLVRRHEVLRTVYVDVGGEPVQVVEAPGRFRLGRHDLSHLPRERREAEARRLARAEAERPFDLGADRMIRAGVVVLDRDAGGAAHDHLLLVTLHHIASDGWSMDILWRELGHLYRAAVAGLAPRLPELPVQYADYAEWQRDWLSGAVLAAEVEWWKARLDGLPALLELPTDHPRPPVATYRGAAVGRRLDGELVDGLRKLGRRHGATLFMTLLAGVEALLGRYSGQRDFAVGSPVAGRNRVEVEPLIGFFVNTLVHRVDLSPPAAGGELTFDTHLARVREAALEVQAHGEMPFEKLVEELAPRRSLAHAPLFQVLFVLQNAPAGAAADRPSAFGPGLESQPLPAGGAGAKYDLNWTAVESADGGLELSLEYALDLFEAAAAHRMLAHLERVLRAAVAEPARPLESLPLMDRAEEARLLFEWGRGAAPAPAEGGTLVAPILARAAEAPQAPALVFAAEGGEATWTYGELAARSAAVAGGLRRRGVGRGSLVAVSLPRTADMVAALLGVLRAGAAYVPVDPGYPVERIRFILEDLAGAATASARLLTTRGVAAALPGGTATDGGTLILEEILADGAVAAPEAGGGGALDDAAPGDLAYVIYTSGSTGRPKGVAIEHRAAAAMVAWGRRAFEPAELAGVLAATSINFDLSVFELFVPLAAGGTVVLVEDALALAGLPAAVRDRVTLVNTVPSVAGELVAGGDLPASARTLNLAGEALKRELADRVYGGGTVERLNNLYGPSEDTTYSTWERVERASADEPAIGTPVDGTRAYVLDRRGGLVPPGVTGELFLAGAGLARGYLARPRQTAERWLPDAFAGEADPGARMYRTGDLVRWLPDGRLAYLGRGDQQVKVRGFRIELGEIEAALAAHPRVVGCAVVVPELDRLGRTLVAYVELEDGADPAADPGRDLAAHLGRRLPEHMVPALFVILDRLPLTPNGKVDRKALPDPERASGQAHREPPRGAAEETLAEVWCAVLGLEAVGRGDHFFDLGGHSLLATQLASRVEERFAVRLPVRQVFETPRLAEMAAAVEAATAEGLPRTGRRQPPLEPVPRQMVPVDGFGPLPAAPLSFAQERLFFIERLEPGGAVYNIPLRLPLAEAVDRGALAAALAALAERHEVLRSRYLEAVPDETVAGDSVSADTVSDFGDAAAEDRTRRPMQVVTPPAAAAVPLHDLSALPVGRRRAEAGRLAAAEANRPFDLALDPVLRARLVRSAAGDHVLLVTLHHIAGDGWSLDVLRRELAALYRAAVEGSPAGLAPLPVQYADYAVWQRRWLSGAVLEAEVEWWRRRLAGLPPVLELPTDRPRPAVASRRGRVASARLSAELTGGVEALGRRHGATLFMTLMAAWQALLARWSGQRDFAVGSPVAGRDRVEVEPLIGFFVNTLVHRADLAPAAGEPLTFARLLERVRRASLQVQEHAALPFEKLVERLAPERSRAYTPLFQVALSLRTRAAAETAASAPTPAPTSAAPAGGAPSAHRTAKFDLALAAEAAGGSLALDLEYATDLFDAATARRLLEHLERLLAAAVEDPYRPLAELPLLGAEERRRLLDEWSGAGRAPSSHLDETIDGRFARLAAARPDATGLLTVPGGDPAGAPVALSYAELERRAGTTVYVLDRAGEPAPVGVWGELLTGGAGLARGYRGRPADTAAAFVPDPFSTTPGARLYRTGDLVRWLPSGELELQGRRDTQVAPPEPMVPAAGPVAPRNDTEARLLELWAKLLGFATGDGEDAALGVEDDFFALGGHSLLALRLVSRIRAELGVELPLSSLFSAGTVAAQAALVERLRDDRNTKQVPSFGEKVSESANLTTDDAGSRTVLDPVLVPVRTTGLDTADGGPAAPLFCVHPVGGNVLAYQPLARHLGRSFYGLQSPSLVEGADDAPASVEGMADRYLAAVRRVRPAGPLHLAGWSMGALVAYEMARKLRAAGEEVALVALIDPPPADPARRLGGSGESAGESAALELFARDLAGVGGLAAGPDRLPALRTEMVEVMGADASVADLFQWLDRRDLLPAGADPELADRLFATFRRNLDALRAYRPDPLEGPLHLLLASGGAAPVGVDAGDPLRGWGGLAPAAVAHELPGDHYSLLREPLVAELGRRLEELAATAGTDTDPDTHSEADTDPDPAPKPMPSLEETS